MFDEKIKTIKKILYYRDVKLLWRVFTASLKISFISSIRQRQLLNFSISPKKMVLTKNADTDKIYKYVCFCLFILRKLGFRYTCFTHSILLCRMLRQAGIEASVNFGARKAGRELEGHCWVSHSEATTVDYQTIFTYP